MLSFVEDLVAQVTLDFDPKLSSSPAYLVEKVQLTLQYWVEHAPIVKKIVRAGKGHLIEERFLHAMKNIEKGLIECQLFPANPTAIQYISTMFASSFFVFITRWIMEDMPYSQDAMTIVFQKTWQPVIYSLLSGEYDGFFENPVPFSGLKSILSE